MSTLLHGSSAPTAINLKVMFMIKKLKDSKSLLKKLDSWWYSSWLGSRWYRFKWRYIQKPIKDAIKTVQWYKNVFRNDSDFDAHSIYAILEYKLKRLLPELVKGCDIHRKEDLMALELAHKIAGRLSRYDYDLALHKKHDKKWGKLKTWFTAVEGKPDYSQMHSSRSKANTPRKKKQERAEYCKAITLAWEHRNKDRELLFNLLNKHLEKWWD
jgi:hypothetical protein